MFTLTAHKMRWKISKGDEVVIFGFGTAYQAIAIAKAYGIVLSKD